MTGRDRTVIVVVLALAAVAAGWFFVVSPKRSQASSLNIADLERADPARQRFEPGGRGEGRGDRVRGSVLTAREAR